MKPFVFLLVAVSLLTLATSDTPFRRKNLLKQLVFLLIAVSLLTLATGDTPFNSGGETF